MKPEQALHKAVAQFLAAALRSPTIWTTFPSGGGGKVRGAQLKAMGLKPGWPDIIVMHRLDPRLERHGSIVVGLELKSETGRITRGQEAMRADFVSAGGHYYLARSLEEVEGFLRGIGIPLHASTMRKAA